jgi:hypothetical protein
LNYTEQSKVSKTIDVSMVRAGNRSGNLTDTLTIGDSLSVLDDPKAVAPPFHGTFRVMTPQDGDKRIIWDNRSSDQIREAKQTFDELIAKGLVPYKVEPSTGRASVEVMEEFDPYAEEVIFLPTSLVVGG